MSTKREENGSRNQPAQEPGSPELCRKNRVVDKLALLAQDARNEHQAWTRKSRNRTKRRIPSTNQHPVAMLTTPVDWRLVYGAKWRTIVKHGAENAWGEKR